MSTRCLHADHEGGPYDTHEDEADEHDKDGWEVVPFGHPAHPAFIHVAGSSEVEVGLLSEAFMSGRLGSGGSQAGQTSDFQNSRAENLDVQEGLVKFQKEQMLTMTADLEVRKRKFDLVEIEMLNRVEEQKEKNLELVKVKTGEMQVKPCIHLKLEGHVFT